MPLENRFAHAPVYRLLAAVALTPPGEVRPASNIRRPSCGDRKWKQPARLERVASLASGGQREARMAGSQPGNGRLVQPSHGWLLARQRIMRSAACWAALAVLCIASSP